MAASRRKARLFRERERELLDVAAALFAQQDWHQVTVDAIADRAEVGKGTVYLHFRSKAEIVARLELREIKRLLGQLLAIDPALPVAEKARHLLAAAEGLRATRPEALGWLTGTAASVPADHPSADLDPAAVRAAVLEATVRLLSPHPARRESGAIGAVQAAALTWALVGAQPPPEVPASAGGGAAGAWQEQLTTALAATWQALLPAG